jgi:hypothetical protein
MSEYQYYEFRAIDRPLTRDQLNKLRSLSSRAEITSSSFINTYNWGDFKGSPEKLMETCFDAFVYVSNFGTQRFMLRLPAGLYEAVKPYATGETVRAKRAGEYVIVELCVEERDCDDWQDGEPWMASLVPLRADLLRGDYRSLYLAWLRSVQDEYLDDDEQEPPVPPGLSELSGGLDSLVEFLDVDVDLIEAAAQLSGEAKVGPSPDDLAAWIREMPDIQKDSMLLGAMLGNITNLQAELMQQYASSRSASSGNESEESPRRTVGQLISLADELAAERKRREAERKAAEQKRKAEQQAKARNSYLDGLAKREGAVWEQIPQLIGLKRPKEYDVAVSLLVDLRDLADRRGGISEFQKAIADLRRLHASKPSFLHRLDKAKL